MTNVNPFEPPQDDLEVDSSRGPPGGHVLASLGARFAAAIIDTLIMLGIMMPLMYAFGVFDDLSRLGKEGSLRNVLWSGAGFAIWISINGYLLAKHGQSLGKRIVGTRIVNVNDNQRAPFSKIVLLRTLPVQIVSAIPIVGNVLTVLDLLLIFRKDRRCIHDHLAGTRVVAAERWLR